MNTVGILIPAYRPEHSLVDLLRSLRGMIGDAPILVIRDGVFMEDAAVFNEVASIPGVQVLTHAINLGKGRALKTGFNAVLTSYPELAAIVTADADGQHLPEDIHKVMMQTQNFNGLVLGARFKEELDVPLRSKIGNGFTRYIFRFLLGMNLKDTQTGLRGIPRKNLSDLVGLPGEKYEFETNMLIKAKQSHWPISEVSIQTVYINQNRGSHFNPIFDSMRIYFLIFRFLFSSLSTVLLDVTLFSIFNSMNFSLSSSLVTARVGAGLYNFFLNRTVVFKSRSKFLPSFLNYWLLVLVLVTVSYFGVHHLSGWGMNPVLAKVLIDIVMFIFSFEAQKFFFDTQDHHAGD